MESLNLRIGQFSESPVLAVARGLGLNEKYNIDWTLSRVPSSPSQFQSLADGDFDIAITSPDNVLLYSSTDKNPLKQQLKLRLIRPIDRGMGLALYTKDGPQGLSELKGQKFGVDVPNSGFAFLLYALAKRLGLQQGDYELASVGATPKRLEALVSGEISATILNAENAVEAEDNGLKKWASSADISDRYLGTVLVEMESSNPDRAKRFLNLWNEATSFILKSDVPTLQNLLSDYFPKLANTNYLELLKSKDYGLVAKTKINQSELAALSEIRESVGAYVPSARSIEDLIHGQLN